ncbi:LamG-like jellyroll fold domain-containing protein [Nonomuraea lactucae]|uniref:LamG-like jellyroll fold domain-containing protein n=1 Tax=Nonomuraea lactucae TaxID=2249762 RepID=UPI0013B385D6|nr:LamG-like jellyroll fold domain-containing protein [Nonomuraea lactucae]
MRGVCLIAAVTLPISLMAAPAIARPTPPPTPISKTSPSPAASPTDAAMVKAKKNNKRVEIEALRSETATYFANPDGKTVHAELSSVPVRIKKDGGWRPIDTTLVAENGVLRPKAALGGLVLSAGEDTVAVTYTREKGRAAIAAPTALPKPMVKGNIATYPSAYGPGIDLVVTVTPSGFRHDVVIRQRPAKDLKIPVPMRLPKGLKLGNGPDKTPGVLDAKGKEIADLTAAPMMDAAAMQDPDKGLIDQAAAEVAGDSIVFTAGSAYLDDPAVTYPVTVTTASETWEGTGIAGDTHVSNVRPDGALNATLQWLLAGRSHSGTQTHRTYIRFNIHGTPLEGGTVHNADLRLHNFNSHTCSDTDSPGIVAHRITSAWTVNEITWNNQPTVATAGQYGNKGAYSATIPCPEGEGELYYSIEQMTQAWMDGEPDEGVRLTSPTETVAQNWRYYRSDEYGGYDTYPSTPRGPVLFIEFTPAERPVSSVAWRYAGDPEVATYEEIEALANDPLRARATTTVTADPIGPTWEEAQAARESGTEFDVQEAEQQEPLPHESDPPVEPEPDTDPPAVVETSPIRDATGIPAMTQIKAIFSEAVTGAEISVKDSSGTLVPGTPVYANKTLTFTPSARLAADSRYSVKVIGASDYTGNSMAPYTWEFMTADASREGLVAAYGMEEGSGTAVADSSGNGNAGVAQGTHWVRGKYGNALSFDGVDAWVTVPHNPSLRLTDEMTLSAWVKPSDASGYRTVIMKDHANGSAYGLYSSDENGLPSAWMLKPDAIQHHILNGSSPLPVDAWSHVAVTYDGANAQLYVNGAQVATAAVTGSLVDDSGALHLGGNTKWGE